MKLFVETILSGIVLISLSSNSAGGNFTLTGNIVEKSTGNPIPDYQVTITSIDVSKSDATTTAVLTNDQGYYSVNFAITDGVIEGYVVSTIDFCSPGNSAFRIVYSNDSSLNVDFSICPVPDTTSSGCYTAFTWYPSDSIYTIPEYYAIQFIDLSQPDITHWFWDFGDGSSSINQNPIHIFTQLTRYNVCLTTINTDSCMSSYCTEINLFNNDTSNTGCQAMFWYNQVIDNPDGTISTTSPYTFQFFDLSYPTPTSWHWDFSDSTSSNEQNPVKTFERPGEYEVCLTIVSDSCRSKYCELIKIMEDSTIYLPCQAMFYAFPDDSTNISDEGYRYNFVDISSGNPTMWSWDFGDSTTSNDQNPVHLFRSQGSYMVTLSISNDSCNSTISLPVWIYDDYIDSTYRDCFTDFWYRRDSLTNCPNCFQFYNLSSEKAISWFWDFGDGNSSTIKNPMHEFDDGDYWVTLTTSNSDGCSSTSSQFVSTSPELIYDGTVIYAEDSIFLPPVDSCFLDFSIAVDSAYINSFSFLKSSELIVNWLIWQNGSSYSIDECCNYSSNGTLMVYLTVICTNDNGKGNQSITFHDIIDIPNDFQDINRDELKSLNIGLYPIPAGDKLFITTGNTFTGKALVSITNVMGQGIYTKEYDMNENEVIEVITSDLQKGIYILTIHTNNRMATAKFVK